MKKLKSIYKKWHNKRRCSLKQRKQRTNKKNIRFNIKHDNSSILILVISNQNRKDSPKDNGILDRDKGEEY